MPTSNKLIVTNLGALRRKYGEAGAEAVLEAVEALIKADAGRGITSELVCLDDRAAMKAAGGKHVTTALDPAKVKAAIDVLHGDREPDYLMLLGGPDVIPHVPLVNGVGSTDPDITVDSDLPYACDDPYSTEIAAFTGPTRVVGRLPDSFGATDPTALIVLLGHAAAAVSRPLGAFGMFAVSARVWKGSSAASLAKILGKKTAVRTSPAGKTGWKTTLLANRMHFFNCHGDTADPRFMGDDGAGADPIALTSGELTGKVSAGTVVGAECCYGAELYEHSLASGVAPICERYLTEGAAGFFGSTTIAFGFPDDVDFADLLVQLFLRRIRDGASLGMAALEARQEYVASKPALDPTDQKTLAQFLLLGDPSLRPVKSGPVPKGPTDLSSPVAVAARSHNVLPSRALDVALRRVRRQVAYRIGRAGTAVPVAERLKRPTSATEIRAQLDSAIGEVALTRVKRTSFAARLDGTTMRFHYASGLRVGTNGKVLGSLAASIVLVRVVEVDGQIVAVQRIVSK